MAVDVKIKLHCNPAIEIFTKYKEGYMEAHEENVSNNDTDKTLKTVSG